MHITFRSPNIYDPFLLLAARQTSFHVRTSTNDCVRVKVKCRIRIVLNFGIYPCLFMQVHLRHIFAISCQTNLLPRQNATNDCVKVKVKCVQYSSGLSLIFQCQCLLTQRLYIHLEHCSAKRKQHTISIHDDSEHVGVLF